MCEDLLVKHCSPTLADVKTANTFTYFYSNRKELISELTSLNHKVLPKGMRIIPLKIDDEKAFIYAYRPERLRKDLSARGAENILKAYGYRIDNPSVCVCELAHRMETCSSFPHEIGLFLGYPPEDVLGFILYGAGNYKSVGAWKVYGDVKQAAQTFALYKKCSAIYQKRFADGVGIETLTVCRASMHDADMFFGDGR